MATSESAACRKSDPGTGEMRPCGPVTESSAIGSQCTQFAANVAPALATDSGETSRVQIRLAMRERSKPVGVPVNTSPIGSVLRWVTRQSRRGSSPPSKMMNSGAEYPWPRRLTRSWRSSAFS